VRLEPDAATVEFTVKSLDVWLEKRALDFEGQVANAQIEQVLVREAIPGKTIAHAGTPCVPAVVEEPSIDPKT
jgi:hypothetical protein